jgi:hypothetical protein
LCSTVALETTRSSQRIVKARLSHTHDTKAGAVIVVDAHDTVTLTGVHVAQLQSSDFHFF